MVVAADHADIVAACEAHAVRAVLTRGDHASGSDRLAEACGLLGLDGDDVVVNVQGDEPLIDPAMIDQAVRPFEGDPALMMSTLRRRMTSRDTTNAPRSPNNTG